MRESVLLEIDGYGNVLLGLPLVLFPGGVSRFLGIAAESSTVYPLVAGALLIGIGIALLVERYKPAWKGLGLGGAIAINLTFGVALAVWLLADNECLSARGVMVLWILVAILVGIGCVEIVSKIGRKSV